MQVRSAATMWLPASPILDSATFEPPGRPPPAAQNLEPPWLAAAVAGALRPGATERWSANIVQLRPAAVLVLLTDGPNGPCVVLTERSADLTDYPGQLSFPGGAADAKDDGPVAAALREAAEEVGLDPDSVQVIGLLPRRHCPTRVSSSTRCWPGRNA